jgi:hypothetical protein
MYFILPKVVCILLKIILRAFDAFEVILYF